MNPESAATGENQTPWQLQMYQKSLKKRQKVDCLMRLLGEPGNRRCLLVSGHDNNGAMNYQFRAAGGSWSWGQVYPEGIPETPEQYAKDVAAFLMWTAEPHLERRKHLGLEVLVYLVIFAGLMYLTRRRLWAAVH